MADPKTKLDEIIANMPRRATPHEPVTREDLERHAREAAEGETVELKEEYEEAEQFYEEAKQAYEEAKSAFEAALAGAIKRNLEELLEEHEDDLSG